MGTGQNGTVYRIDRHPSMSKHPVTPATESDLRLHIGEQTGKKIGSIDIDQMQVVNSDIRRDPQPFLFGTPYEINTGR